MPPDAINIQVDASRESLLAWQQLLTSTSPAVTEGVKHAVANASREIVDLHYGKLTQHPRASVFLSHDQVERRLRPAMLRWLERTFGVDQPDSLAAVVAYQIEIGEVHARIELPPDLMAVAVRVLKSAIMERVLPGFEDMSLRLAACMYINDVLQIADALMNSAYVRTVQRHVRNDEAYRTIALKHDAVLERERQRAALSEWAQKFLFGVRRHSRRGETVQLGKSEFALWMKHKAQVLFDGMTDVKHIHDAIVHVDEVIVPQLLGPGLTEDREERLVEDLEKQIELIRYLVADLFDRLSQVEEGRDTVTRLYNRRYLLSILSRELGEHRRNSQCFCVLQVKIDSTTRYGPDGDSRALLLQRVACSIQGAIRAGDHAFRYAEDEFLVIAVESTENGGAWLANKIRNDVRTHSTMLRSSAAEAITVSIGVSVYDGHPDYQRMLDRAQSALDAARARGGNAFEVA